MNNVLKFRKCPWALECKGWKGQVKSCPYWHPGEPDEPPGVCDLAEFSDDTVFDLVVNSNDRSTLVESGSNELTSDRSTVVSEIGSESDRFTANEDQTELSFDDRNSSSALNSPTPDGSCSVNSQCDQYVNICGSSDQLATRGEGSIPSPSSSDQGDGIQMTLPVDTLRLIESCQLTPVKSGRVQGAVQVLPFAARWNATVTKSISFCKGVDTLKYEMESGSDFSRGKPKSHDNSGKINAT